MEKLKFSCTLVNNSDTTDLAIELWLDNKKFFDTNVKKGDTPTVYEFNKDETDHSFRIVLKNKTIDHTTVDDSGKILSDALISIKDISFDEINIDQLFFENAVYSHKTNNEDNELLDYDFYGHLGCNGTVTFNFYTPFHIWLLENI